jgi:hypothetical protein
VPKPLDEKIAEAIDDALCDQIKGAMMNVWQNVSAGDSLDVAIERFKVAAKNIRAIHDRVKKELGDG